MRRTRETAWQSSDLEPETPRRKDEMSASIGVESTSGKINIPHESPFIAAENERANLYAAAKESGKYTGHRLEETRNVINAAVDAGLIEFCKRRANDADRQSKQQAKMQRGFHKDYTQEKNRCDRLKKVAAAYPNEGAAQANVSASRKRVRSLNLAVGKAGAAAQEWEENARQYRQIVREMGVQNSLLATALKMIKSGKGGRL